MEALRKFFFGPEKVVVKDDVIPAGLYARYVLLTTVVLPDNLLSIGNRAFFKCRALVSIRFPDKLNSIGSEAFYGCSALSEISFSNASLDYIGDSAFAQCPSLKEVPYFTAKQSGYRVFGYLEHIVSVLIPEGSLKAEGRVELNGHNFYSVALPKLFGFGEECSYVVLSGKLPYIAPSSLEALASEMRCLNQLEALKVMTLVPGVVKWHPQLVVRYGWVQNIVVHNGIKSVPERVFTYNNLTSVEFPPSLTRIGAFSFAESHHLSEVTFAKSDREILIGIGAFKGSSGVRRMVFLGDNKKITFASSSMQRCTSLSALVFKGKPKEIYFGERAFENCAKSTMCAGFHLKTPVGTKVILDKGVFYGAKVLTVNMPGMEVISYQAFMECAWLYDVVLSNQVREIRAAAFSHCTALPRIVLNEGLQWIGSAAFCNCKFSSIELPFSLTTVKESAFFRCVNLVRVTVSQYVDLYHAGLEKGVQVLRKAPRILAKMPPEILRSTGLNPRVYVIDAKWTEILLLCNQRNKMNQLRAKLPSLPDVAMFVVLSFMVDSFGDEELPASRYRILESRQIIDGRVVRPSNASILLKRAFRDLREHMKKP